MKNLMTMGVLGMLLAGAGRAAAQDPGSENGFERIQFGVERGYSDYDWIRLPRAPQRIVDCTPRFDYGWNYGAYFRIEVRIDYTPRPVCPRRPDVWIQPSPYCGR